MRPKRCRGFVFPGEFDSVRLVGMYSRLYGETNMFNGGNSYKTVMLVKVNRDDSYNHLCIQRLDTEDSQKRLFYRLVCARPATTPGHHSSILPGISPDRRSLA